MNQIHSFTCMEIQLLRYILKFVGSFPLWLGLERRDSSSMGEEVPVDVSFGSWRIKLPLHSREQTKSEGAGGYDALCLDLRNPLRISLKNPSPPYQ